MPKIWIATTIMMTKVWPIRKNKDLLNIPDLIWIILRTEIHKLTFLEAKFGRGDNIQSHDLKFASVAKVQVFKSILTRLGTLSMEVTDNKVRSIQQEIAASTANSNTEKNAKLLQPLYSTIMDEDVNLLVKIVNVTDLPVADL
jgi:hypothetical protein